MTMPSLQPEVNYPFHFDSSVCNHCSARCCRGKSGNIWVNGDDMTQIITYLKSNPIDAMLKFFEKKLGRCRIKEQNSGEEFRCIFLNADYRCDIYPVRPIQCRTFPHWEHYKDPAQLLSLKNECPGVVEKSPNGGKALFQIADESL